VGGDVAVVRNFDTVVPVLAEEFGTGPASVVPAFVVLAYAVGDHVDEEAL